MVFDLSKKEKKKKRRRREYVDFVPLFIFVLSITGFCTLSSPSMTYVLPFDLFQGQNRLNGKPLYILVEPRELEDCC